MSQELVKQNNQVSQFDFFNPEQFATMQRVCALFACSELVPDLYRVSDKNPKDKAIANCMIAIETAQRIGASPLMVMQNMYIVYGQPAWSSKFLIATVNGCGRYNSIKYKMTNLGLTKFNNQDVENWECVAYTTEKGSDEVLESVPVSIAMSIAEGWYGKNGSKWRTIPKLMLQYRAATFWTRAYAPELSMGIRSEDEVQDIQDIPYEDVTKSVEKEIKANANGKSIGFDQDPAQTATSQQNKEEVHTSGPVDNGIINGNPVNVNNGQQPKAPF